MGFFLARDGMVISGGYGEEGLLADAGGGIAEGGSTHSPGCQSRINIQ
jgi:hypothetical protein